MTDANGARNISSSDTSASSASASISSAGSVGSGGANSPVSRTSATPAKSAASSKSAAPKSRYRTNSDRPKRRRTRNSDSSRTQGTKTQDKPQTARRRRLFGAAPDRVKRKSSSRTRALKARTPSSPEKKGTATLPGKKLAGSTDKSRPALPATSYPGKVPPARALVRSRRRASRRYMPLRKGIQFVIVALGIAAIAGTLLKMRPEVPASETASETTVQEATPTAKSFPMPLSQEITALKTSLQSLPNSYPGMTPKVFYIDVDTGQYVSVEGTETIAAASTIKLPVLLAFFEEVDAGRIDPNQTIEIQQTQIAEGSGDMQLSSPGTQFTALEVASQMIINSDNTATNMMIDLLGGTESLNNRFQLKGLEKTVLNNPLPDLEGTNTTSARDLVHVMLLISQGDDISMRSRDRMLSILNRTYNKDLLAADPAAASALTYNKTGDIQSVLGDVALIDLPNGKRYAIATLVERPANDGRASELIRTISKQTYQEAAKALPPSVTPLGNGDQSSDGAASTSESEASPAATSGSDSPAAENAGREVEEEPYPSANP